MIYDKFYNACFHQKLELFQYNSLLDISGAIRDTSKEKFYEEVSLEPHQLSHWLKKLGSFYKIYKNNQPSYLSNIILH